MLLLLFTLGTIALFDSLSMVPLALVPMTVCLGSKHPWASAGSFLGGMYAAYFLCGLVLLTGAEFIIETFGAYFERLWNRPYGFELAGQIFIGLLLIVSAWYMHRRRKPNITSSPAPVAAPGAMFVLGATMILIGMPGAVPYVAAIERIVRFDPDWIGATAMVAFYNLIFVLPFTALVVLRFLMPHRAGSIFQMCSKLASKIMPHVVVMLFFVAGLVMVADGIGWFLGHPLLPVSGEQG